MSYYKRRDIPGVYSNLGFVFLLVYFSGSQKGGKPDDRTRNLITDQQQLELHIPNAHSTATIHYGRT